MSSSSQQRTVRWLCRLYGVMLFAYPVGLRQRYSREMAVVFRDQVRDVMKLGGGWALESEKRAAGDVGLFGEHVEVLRPVQRNAQFATKVIRED